MLLLELLPLGPGVISPGPLPLELSDHSWCALGLLWQCHWFQRGWARRCDSWFPQGEAMEETRVAPVPIGDAGQPYSLSPGWWGPPPSRAVSVSLLGCFPQPGLLIQNLLIQLGKVKQNGPRLPVGERKQTCCCGFPVAENCTGVWVSPGQEDGSIAPQQVGVHWVRVVLRGETPQSSQAWLFIISV